MEHVPLPDLAQALPAMIWASPFRVPPLLLRLPTFEDWSASWVGLVAASAFESVV